MSQGAWGERLARSFHLDAPPTVLARTAEGRVLAATELRRDEPVDAMSAPLGEDDAYLIGLQLRGMRRHELWLDGRPMATRSPAAGMSCIFDLKRNPVAWLGEPFHALQFYVPCAALSEMVEASRRPAINDLNYEAGAFVADPVIESLGRCLHAGVARVGGEHHDAGPRGFLPDCGDRLQAIHPRHLQVE